MIGLLGGTFDPVHYGHLRPANEIKQRLALASLHVMPAAVPPHRALPVATAEQRLQMVTLAVTEFPGMVADDREIRRGGVSYTVVTLEQLRAEGTDDAIALLVGTDAFLGLPSWYRWERLLALAHIIVMQRPGQSLPASGDMPDWAASRLCHSRDELAQRHAGGILVVSVTPQEVSATQLRALMARGEEPPVELMPPAVWSYIQRQGIYRSSVS